MGQGQNFFWGKFERERMQIENKNKVQMSPLFLICPIILVFTQLSRVLLGRQFLKTKDPAWQAFALPPW